MLHTRRIFGRSSTTHRQHFGSMDTCTMLTTTVWVKRVLSAILEGIRARRQRVLGLISSSIWTTSNQSLQADDHLGRCAPSVARP